MNGDRECDQKRYFLHKKEAGFPTSHTVMILFSLFFFSFYCFCFSSFSFLCRFSNGFFRNLSCFCCFFYSFNFFCLCCFNNFFLFFVLFAGSMTAG
jgi:hypothetical protein